MDLYDRTVKGMRLRPVAAKSADVAGVLFQAVTPQRWGYMPDAQQGPYGSLSISSSTDQVHVIETVNRVTEVAESLSSSLPIPPRPPRGSRNCGPPGN